MRSMPAMPMAESRPPIVVGIRQTKSATSTVTVIGLPWPAAATLYFENGNSVAHTNRKMIVIAASKISSAISFGVFCRFAPSTRPIMRSRNVSPGLADTRTTSQSESTRVPPVTLLRSPPLSRMTGALSPVIALSSTEATPSMTSPSLGIMSPASTSTTSSLRKRGSRDKLLLGAVARRVELLGLHVAAGCPQRIGLRLAAPFGHRFGKIGEQHREPQPGRNAKNEPGDSCPGIREVRRCRGRS